MWRKAQKADPNTDKDADRLARLLADHNVTEENGVYPKLDELLTKRERAAIHQQMKDAALG